MTQQHDDAFTPDTVDERIDQLASLSPQEGSSPSMQIVQRLQSLCEDDQRATERVWHKLIQHVDMQKESDSGVEYRQPGSLKETREGTVFMLQGTHVHGKRGPTRLTLVAAIVLATVLVSSLLWVLHLTHTAPASLPANSTPIAFHVPTSPPGLYLTKPGKISRLDERTRKVLWQTSIPPTKDKVYNDMAGRPLVINDAVYLIRGNEVFAFDATKGMLRWSSVFDRSVSIISTTSSLLYISPLVPDNQFYAVDPLNGKITAIYTSSQGKWNHPEVVDGIVYDVTYRGLYAQRLSDKKLIWRQQVEADQDLEWIAVKNGMVYVSSVILATGKRKNSGGLLYAFDASTGKKRWQSLEMPVGVRNFIVTDDMVYCASVGDLDAFDSRTGKHIWHLHMDVVGLLMNAGVLYVDYITNTGSYDGGIAALQPENGKSRWQTSLTGTGEPHLLGLQRGIIYTLADNGTVGSIDALRASDGSRSWRLSISGDATKFDVTVA